MGYTITILFIVSLCVGIGVTIGYFLGKGIFYQKGINDEAARWKNRDEINIETKARVE